GRDRPPCHDWFYLIVKCIHTSSPEDYLMRKCRYTPLKRNSSEDSDCSKVFCKTTERSEPSSRKILIGEQPNPWELLHPQDILSRHRGAELCRRYGRLGTTS